MSETSGVAASGPWPYEQHFARVGEIELCYSQLGDPTGPTLLLIGGLAMQLVSWPRRVLALFVEAGLHLVCYDHRDSGRSTWCDSAGMPDILRALRRDSSALGYGLDDLASDAVGLLDVLGVSSAHLFGVSMGGMVGQLIALEHPNRVESLCSALSTTGDRRVGQSSNAALQVLLRPAASTREQALEQALAAARVTRSPSDSEGLDLELELERSAEAYDRGHNPAGSARQLAAVLAAPDRTARLSEITCPTLVVHGTVDQLIDSSGGRATATAIPGSELLLCEGMGHDLPRRYATVIVDAVVTNIARATQTPSPPTLC